MGVKAFLNRKNGYIKFFILFLPSCILIYSLNLFYGRSLLYADANQSGDGLLQHFNALAYYGEWLRTILRNIVVGHKIELPMWDSSIGLGGDVITTLGYYVIGDPLAMLSVFVPREYTEYLYNFLVIVRVYLSGIAFFIFCKYHGYKESDIFPGCLIYMFSFYTIVVSVLHPFYLNPLIYLPMILLGVDKFLNENRPFCFIFSVFLAAISNFYFFYMMCFVIAAYVFLRGFQRHKRGRKIGEILVKGAKLVGFWFLGAGMSAALFLPSASAVLGRQRVETGVEVPLFYEPLYYAKLLIAFVNASADYYAALGFTVVGLLAVALLFFKTKRREKTLWKIAFAVCILALCIPYAGHVLNGFSYVTNRWVWTFVLVVSVIVVDQMPKIVKMNAKLQLMLAMLMVVFAIPTFYFRSGGNLDKLVAGAKVCGLMAVVLGSVWLTLCVICFKKPKYKETISRGFVFAVILINLFFNMFGFFSPVSGNDIKNHGNFGLAWEQLMTSPAKLIAGVKEAGKFRFDTADLGFEGVKANSAMQYGRNGTSFYYSVTNSTISHYLCENEMNIYTDYVYTDMDSRTFLDVTLGVKYFIVPSEKGTTACLPYGYDEMVASDEKYEVYMSETALPMAFFYDTFYLESKYKKMTASQKQQTVLQAAVVDPKKMGNSSAAELKEPVLNDFESQYKIVCDPGIWIEGNTITVEKAGAIMRIYTDCVTECERYLEWKNLWFCGSGIANIGITDGTVYKTVSVAATDSTRYAGIHNVICNMGYRQRGADEYELCFAQKGEYKYDQLSILNQPLDMIQAQVEKLQTVPVLYELKKGVFQNQLTNKCLENDSNPA